MIKAYHFIKPYWKKGIIPVLYMVIATGISFVFPLFPKWAMDEIIGKGMGEKLLPLALAFFALVVLQQIFAYLNEVSFFKFQNESILDIQKRVTDKIFSYPMEFFDQNHSGYLMGRIRGDVEGLSYIFSESLVTILMDFFKFIGGVTILLFINVKLTLICSLALPFLLVKILSARAPIKEVNKTIIAENAQLEKELSDTLQGVEVLKSYSQEEEGKKRIASALKKFQQAEVKRNGVFVGYRNHIEFIVGAGQVLLLFFGIREVLNGGLTIGEYVAFMGYVIYMYSPIQNIGSFMIFFDYAKRSYEKIDELLSVLPEDSGGIHIDTIEKIRIKDLFFSYAKDQEVIANFNLSLQKGDRVLLLGESGSGKSTLLKLLIGLYRPSKGHIYYNDRDLRELELKNVRQKIGFISQDIFLFNKSIRDNIVFNDMQVDDQNILAVLDQCRIKDKVLSLKMGLDHVLSEKGSDFSGGERQRLSLARALIKQPDVILMDEALANVDAKTEEEVERIILNLFHDRIIIKISHRPTTTRAEWKRSSLQSKASFG